MNLNERTYRAAKSLAMAEDCSISAAVNKLLERALDPVKPSGDRKNGWPVVKGGRQVTSEEVYRIENSLEG